MVKAKAEQSHDSDWVLKYTTTISIIRNIKRCSTDSKFHSQR